MADEVDARIEADAQMARALEIVVSACDDDDFPARDYTPDELETLFFALGTAMVQLAKLPGGKEARERFYHNATDALLQRGRQDILDALKAGADRTAQAKAIIRRSYGDNVDFSPGTTGYSLLRIVENELDQLDELRTKMLSLAATLGG